MRKAEITRRAIARLEDKAVYLRGLAENASAQTRGHYLRKAKEHDDAAARLKAELERGKK